MTAVPAALRWTLLAFSLAWASLAHAVRPLTWRRPVRAEFSRFLALTCLDNLTAVLVTGAIVGIVLFAQGLYWLDQFGQADAVANVIMSIVVRELGPLVVSLLMLGTGGIAMIGEVAAMRSGGQIAVLDRQGIDPFLLLIVPRIVAMIIALFVHSVLFITVALITGYAGARLMGAITIDPISFVTYLLTAIGANGYIVIPAKAVALGLTIGAICSLTALDNGERGATPERRIARGFIRSVSGVLAVGALLSLTL